MVQVETVRSLEALNPDATRILVKAGDKFFMVSSAHVVFSGFETLVFKCDESGKVLDWIEVAGGRGMSQAEAIEDLERALERGIPDREDDE